MYMSEIRFQVLDSDLSAIDESKLKRLLCYESQHQSQSNEKSLVQFDYEKAVSIYLGAQGTFKGGGGDSFTRSHTHTPAHNNNHTHASGCASPPRSPTNAAMERDGGGGRYIKSG